MSDTKTFNLGFKLDDKMGSRLVAVNTLIIVAPMVLLFLMHMKRQDLKWVENILLFLTACGIAYVVAFGIAKVGHTALALGEGQGWAKFLLLSSWLGLCFLMVSASTIVLVIVSSKEPYLIVIQPDYVKANWPNVLACFLFSLMAEVTILGVMYSDALAVAKQWSLQLQELEKEKDEAIMQRNSAQDRVKAMDTDLQEKLQELADLKARIEEQGLKIENLLRRIDEYEINAELDALGKK